MLEIIKKAILDWLIFRKIPLGLNISDFLLF